MHLTQIVGIVVEVIVVGIVGVLLDRCLGNTVAVCVLLMGLAFLVWLHWSEIKPIISPPRRPVVSTNPSPPPSEAPPPAPVVPKPPPKPRKPIANPLEITSFNSTQDITISNDGPDSLFVIRLEASEEKGSDSFALNFDIEPGKTGTRRVDAGFPRMRTIDTLADSWQEHYEKAVAQYRNCWQFSFFSQSDPGFQQIKDHYSIQGSRLIYDELQGILYYKVDGVPGIKQQTVPLVVIVTVNADTCPP